MFLHQDSHRHEPPLLDRLRCQTVYRRRRSYSVLRLPARFGLSFGSPCFRPTSSGARSLRDSLGSPATPRVRPKTLDVLVDGSPAPPGPEYQGRVGISQVSGPSSSRVPWSNTPPSQRALALSVTQLLPSSTGTLSASGIRCFRGCIPTVHSLACLCINASVAEHAARLATDLPGWALAGRVSHPLDDLPSFS